MLIATIVLRSLHADQVLDGAGDSDRHVHLRRDRLAGAADLALHRQPAASQIGRDAASSAPSASASFCTSGMFSASLMPRPTETMISAAAEIHRALRFAEQLQRLGADLAGRDLRRELLHRRGARRNLIGAVRARLQRSELRSRAAEADIRVHLALKQLPHQHQLRRPRRDATPRR